MLRDLLSPVLLSCYCNSYSWCTHINNSYLLNSLFEMEKKMFLFHNLNSFDLVK